MSSAKSTSLLRANPSPSVKPDTPVVSEWLTPAEIAWLRQQSKKTSAYVWRMSRQHDELKAMAREHWTKWLPQRVAALKAIGKLDEELHAAAHLAQDDIRHLVKQGCQEHKAREMALPKFILLAPEGGGQGDWEHGKLGEMKREDQKRQRQRAAKKSAGPSPQIIPYRGLTIILDMYNDYTATVYDRAGNMLFSVSGPQPDLSLRKARTMIDITSDGPR